MGGGGPSSSVAATGTGGAGGCGDCDLDCDTYLAVGACGGADCDDLDEDVHPGQLKWFDTPRKNGGSYDYDCSGADEHEFATFACSGAVCADMSAVFLSVAPVACGQMAPFGNCALLLCTPTVTDPTKTVRCR